MAFRFRLQKVLDYRQSAVDRLRLELAMHHLQRAQEQGRLDLLRQEEAAQLAEQRHRGPCQVEELIALAEQLDRHRLRIAEQQSLLGRLEGEIEAIQRRLDAASKNAKVLEKLREHQADDFQRAEMRIERNETAETAALITQRAGQ